MNTKDNVLMKTALLWAKESSCKRLKVGAVIAKDTRIISTGYNGTISGEDNCCEDSIPCLCHVNSAGVMYTMPEPDCNMCKGLGEVTETKETVLHAEQNALMFALRNGISTVGTTMYVTHAPCGDCAKLIAQAGIVKVVYNNLYRSTVGLELLEKVGVVTESHQLNVSSRRHSKTTKELMPLTLKTDTEYINMAKRIVKLYLRDYGRHRFSNDMGLVRGLVDSIRNYANLDFEDIHLFDLVKLHQFIEKEFNSTHGIPEFKLPKMKELNKEHGD